MLADCWRVGKKKNKIMQSISSVQGQTGSLCTIKQEAHFSLTQANMSCSSAFRQGTESEAMQLTSGFNLILFIMHLDEETHKPMLNLSTGK